MSLGRFKWLFSDGWSTYCTYLPIPTIRILKALQRSTIAVGNNGAGTHNVVSGPRNESVGVCDIVMDGRTSCIRVYSKLLLEAES